MTVKVPLELKEFQLQISGRPEPRRGLPLADTFADAGISGGLALEQRPALLAVLDAIGNT